MEISGSNVTTARPGDTLPDIAVTASRLARDLQSEPFLIYHGNALQAVIERGIRTTASLLDGLPSVMIQKTAYGQTSPFLRGFTGYHTLCLIDGIRINNSVFRAGPNQYWNTIDPLSLSRFELVMNPGSILYGSDAVGGVLNAVSLNPPEWSGKRTFTPRIYYRGATAENSHVARLQLDSSLTPQLGAVVGFSWKDFGDLRGGKDVGVQKHTGYAEFDLDLKVRYEVDNSIFTLGHQTISQNDVWRTHRTIYGIDWKGLSRGDDLAHSFDQRRDLTFIRYRVETGRTFFDSMEVTVSRHVMGEDNYRVKKDGQKQIQGFDVQTWGTTLQLAKESTWARWVYGADYYRDSIGSYGRNYSADGLVEKIEIQGPVANDASYALAGAFLDTTVICLDGGLEITPGVRYSYAAANVGQFKDPLSGEASSMKADWETTIGSLRLLTPITADRRHTCYAGVAQAFRAPNLSDLTRLDIARSGEIEIPSPGVRPERFTTFEIGFKSQTARLRSTLSYYYTSIDGMIVRTPTGRITSDGMVEVAKRNSGFGYIHGLELSDSFYFLHQWSTWLNCSWQEGEIDIYPTSSAEEKIRDYVSRLMPFTAQAGVRWQAERGKVWAEVLADIAEKANKLSSDDRRDTQRIPPGGTPGYLVFSARAGVKLPCGLSFTLTVENIFDKDYRIHGSGVNEPGRNLSLSANWTF
ncbi:MAG: TonB-dependent receptor [Kiritimatiellia bacterium]